jgi:hypothetical protein
VDPWFRLHDPYARLVWRPLRHYILDEHTYGDTAYHVHPPHPEHASEACKRAPNRHYFCIILVAINKARVTKMKHGVKLNRLGRASGPRRLLLRSLATELIQRERIVTTVTRAKALKSPADKVWFRSKDVCCLPCSQSLRRTTLVLGAFKLAQVF